MTTAEIGGLTFYGDRTSTGLHFKRLIDWDSLPDSKTPVEPRPQAHGNNQPAEDFREGPLISVEGWYRGTTRVDALTMRRNLVGALAGKNLRLTVTDELGPTSRDVSVRGVPLGDLFGAFFAFNVNVLAYDSRRYGPTATVSTGVPALTGGRTWPATWPITWTGGGSTGRVTALNPGTAETYSLFEVTGGLSGGFSITEVGTGREIRFEREIPVGSTVFVNPRTGEVYIDAPGNDVSGFLTRADFATVPPAGQSIYQFVPLGVVTGSPALTARTAPAYS